MTSPPPPAPGAPASCARHADRPTGLSCTRCGRPACPDCLREASVGAHCVDCVAAAEAATPRARRGTPGADRAVIVVALIVVNLAVFALTVATAGGSIGGNAASPLFRAGGLAPLAVADGQWWRVLASGFLHYGPLHLAFNMIALWVIGNDLERFLGPLRFGVLYGLSLLGGSAAVMVLAEPRTLTAGASGAVFGLMGALAVLLVRRGSMAAAGPALTMIAINVVLTFVLPFLSVAGHLGGLLTGALVALALTETPARARSGAVLGIAASIGLTMVATIALRALTL